MERAVPMDRLIRATAGFGQRQEIAVQAAFKAACDNKQTADPRADNGVGLPAFPDIQKRLHDFPVRVDYLSRARSAKQTKQVLEDLEAGRIDILVGTHKLIKGKECEVA